MLYGEFWFISGKILAAEVGHRKAYKIREGKTGYVGEEVKIACPVQA